MTLIAVGYRAGVVALSGIAKRKGVLSQANLVIFVKVLVGNIATTGHHVKAVFLDQLLERKSNKKKKAKGMNRLGNICIHDRCNSHSTEAPTGKPCISLISLQPLRIHSLSTSGFDFSRKHPTSSEN
jgi:hypothetical protein